MKNYRPGLSVKRGPAGPAQGGSAGVDHSLSALNASLKLRTCDYCDGLITNLNITAGMVVKGGPPGISFAVDRGRPVATAEESPGRGPGSES